MVGNKGGGRPTAYKERENAEKLFDAFYGRVDIEGIEERIRNNQASLWDRILLTAMEGDTRMLQTLANKALPEKIDVTGDGITQVIVQRKAN